MELPSKKLSLQVGKPDWVPPAFFIVSIASLLLSVVFWWMTFVSNWSVKDIYVTEAQTIKDLQRPVKECEAKAVDGFTCILIPLMVSKQYAKEHTEEFK